MDARAIRLAPRAARALAALSPAIGLFAACSSEPEVETTGRGVLVIAIDALRADHVSWYGYDRRTTASIDDLAKEGVSFLDAWTPSPEPLPAHAAVLTGCEPMLARRSALDQPAEGSLLSSWLIPDALPRLAREFLAHGYATAAFVDHPAVSTVYGFGAGFQHYDGFRSEAVLPDMKPGFEDVASKFFNWLTRQDPSQDWFAYVHVNDLERPWRHSDPKADTFFEPRAELSAVPPVAEADPVFFAVPRTRWSGATLSLGEYEARYDGALRDLDRNFGRFFEGIRRKGRWANTTIVVVGTYGVGFGESGLYLVSGTLSDADLRVPVIVRPAPGLGSGHRLVHGARATSLFSLMDLAPTLLDLHGIRVPPGMQGVSHAGFLRGGADGSRAATFAAGGLQAGFAALDGRYCYEWSSPAAAQPGPHSPLTVSWYGDAADHRGEFRAFLHDRSAKRSLGHLGTSARDPEAEQRLAAAGRDYYAWVEKARAALQGGPAALAALEPSVRAELELRRLLGE